MNFDYNAPNDLKEILAYTEANPSELPEIIAKLESDRDELLAEAARLETVMAKYEHELSAIEAWLEVKEETA